MERSEDSERPLRMTALNTSTIQCLGSLSSSKAFCRTVIFHIFCFITIAMSPAYTHISLERDERQIRLIRLHAGSGSPIRCTSFVESLNNISPYQALSYAWGDPSVRINIVLDEQAFGITQNLFSALKSLQDPQQDRTLWIDALCINQRNECEKAWQVQLMGEIYSKCSKAILWIGNEEEESDAWCVSRFKDCCASSGHINMSNTPFRGVECQSQGTCRVDQISINGEHHRVRRDSGFSLDNHFAQRCKWHGRRPKISTLKQVVDMLQDGIHLSEITTLSNAISGNDSLTFESVQPILALGAFLNRKWWSRSWTVQEAALPPDSIIRCGSLEFQFKSMASSADALYRHSKTCCSSFFTRLAQRLEPLSYGEATINIFFKFQKYFNTLDLARKQSHVSDCHIMDYLYNFHDREAKDPRDKVYALLGLLPPKFALPVNYAMDIAQWQRDMSFHLLASYPDSTLSILWKETAPQDTVCSWVKNFDKETTVFNRRIRSEQYRAGSAKMVKAKRLNDSIISIVGFKVDVVSQVSPECHFETTYSKDQFSSIRGWAQFLLLDDRSQFSYPGGGTLKDAFIRTLTGDLQASETSSLGSNEEAMDISIQSFLAGEPGDTLVNTSLAEELNISAAGRRLFTTRRGYIGLGPEWMRPGDEVWTLFGGSVPFILRPSEKACSHTFYKNQEVHRRHVVIGDCYVQGIMFGESVSHDTRGECVHLE